MCSVTAMRLPSIGPDRVLHDQRCCSAGLLTPDGALTLRSPIPLQMGLATTARDGDSPAFALVSLCMEPPAGIEPATPSLPWIGGQAPC